LLFSKPATMHTSKDAYLIQPIIFEKKHTEWTL